MLKKAQRFADAKEQKHGTDCKLDEVDGNSHIEKETTLTAPELQETVRLSRHEVKQSRRALDAQLTFFIDSLTHLYDNFREVEAEKIKQEQEIAVLQEEKTQLSEILQKITSQVHLLSRKLESMLHLHHSFV